MTESSNPRVSSLVHHHHHHHPHRLSHHPGRELSANFDISIKQLTRAKMASQHKLVVDQQLLYLYYQNFHPAHPILVPLSTLQGSLAEYIPPQLLTVMRYIGAHYHPDESIRQTLKASALETTSFTSPDAATDGFWVQCMLLLAISEHAHDGESKTFIEPAVSCALELGMQDSSFAKRHGYDSPFLEEMWRRTYWELYVVDVLLSAPRQQESLLYLMESDVSLPCDEVLYNEAESTIPQGCLLKDLTEDSSRGPQDGKFSSFAYRINATRLLGQVLSLSGAATDNIFKDTDNALSEWQRQFPFRADDSQADSTHFGEMIFQAQMIVHSAVIYLHQPLSNLPRLWAKEQDSRPSITSRFFFPPSSSTTKSSFPSSSNNKIDLFNPHTARIMQEADSLTKLLTQTHSAVERHSPFLIHGVVVGSLVYVAAYVQSPGENDLSKQRMSLAVGVLKKLGVAWPLAGTVKKELSQIYRDAVSDSG